MNHLIRPNQANSTIRPHAAALLAAALLAFLLAYIFFWSPNFTDPFPGGDYFQFYLAARIFRDGSPERLYDFAYQIRFQNDRAIMPFSLGNLSFLYIYPPFFVWFCLPFSYLPFKAGAVAWVLFMTGCLLAAVRFLSRTPAGTPVAFGYALLASLLFTPTLLSLYSCQNATLSLLILSATYALLRSGRPLAAGALFTLLAFKPQLTLVIAGAMLWKGQWRFLLGGLAAGLVLAGASLAVSPVASADYLRLAPALSRWWIAQPNFPLAEMSSWRGFWWLLLAGWPTQYAETAAAVSTLVTVALLAWTLRGPLQTTSEGFAPRFAALVLATVLISPHLLAYDLTLLVLPMGLAVGSRIVPGGNRARDSVWLMTGALFAAASVSRWVAASAGLQVVVPLMLVYLAVLARLGRARPPAQPAASKEQPSPPPQAK
jgi:Glycosyltransferase family 87